MDDREVRLTPHCLHWAAYFHDAPHERCLGDSPQDAMQRLRELAKVREEELARYRRQQMIFQRKRNTMLAVSAACLALLVTAFIVRATANAARPTPEKMYAHRVLHQHPAN
jgi:hypothetical protein